MRYLIVLALLLVPVSAASADTWLKVEYVNATPGQTNAARSAKSYIQSQGFSKKGLIEQLKFEGFTTAQATYGANHCACRWNAQAVRSAKSYLRSQAFSRSGLIEQLMFEGYTRAQAVYGVNRTGL